MYCIICVNPAYISLKLANQRTYVSFILNGSRPGRGLGEHTGRWELITATWIAASVGDAVRTIGLFGRHLGRICAFGFVLFCSVGGSCYGKLLDCDVRYSSYCEQCLICLRGKYVINSFSSSSCCAAYAICDDNMSCLRMRLKTASGWQSLAAKENHAQEVLR